MQCEPFGPAQGYLTKEAAATQLIGAIRKVAYGRPYLSDRVAEHLAMDVMASAEVLVHKQLSDWEFEVFSMLVFGKSLTEIGNALHVSVKTVSTHKTRLMQKMGLGSMSELVQYAVAPSPAPRDRVGWSRPGAGSCIGQH